MNSEDRLPLTDPSQVPAGMTEEQAREFWASHEITEEYLDKAGSVAREELPKFRPRTKPVSVRLDADVLQRLKQLAEIKNKGYQTLLKEFVSERLYEEEKREKIIGHGEGRKTTRVTYRPTLNLSTLGGEHVHSRESERWDNSVSQTLMLLQTLSNTRQKNVNKSERARFGKELRSNEVIKLIDLTSHE